MLNWLRKRNNIIIGICQQTRKVDYMYLAFKNLEMCSEKRQQCSET